MRVGKGELVDLGGTVLLEGLVAFGLGAMVEFGDGVESVLDGVVALLRLVELGGVA